MDESNHASSTEESSRFAVNGAVFFPSAALILAFVAFGAVFTDTARGVFTTVQSTITMYSGWFYTLAVGIFLIFVIGLAVSPYGRVKLGPKDSEPDYSYTGWFAMLFSAGMGIGLLFYSVAEPVIHFLSPPGGASGGTVEAAREAMQITFFHWGVHAWAIYIVVGLSLAYFSYRHDLPLTLRSALYPIIGDRIYGPIGHTVDTFAVLGTMFGVANSLGLGVMQINAGLTFLLDIPNAVWVQLSLIAGITGMATVSVVLGLDRGIRRLSELNLGLGLLLLTFVFIVGPTVFLTDAFVQNLGGYLQNIVSMTFQTYAFEGSDWQSRWTLFYWAWWIAWSPFVGMFIARISRGRTIREFVSGVMLVPTVVTFLWLTVFGDTGIRMILNGAGGAVQEASENAIPTALFALLSEFPLTAVSSAIATFVVITFFVTSSDSGSLVIDIITSGGKQDPPVAQRIFWAVTEGAVASVLLLAGGLEALQTAAITTALPFTVVLIVMCYGLIQGLRRDRVPPPKYLKTHSDVADRGDQGTEEPAAVSTPVSDDVPA
ncbi:choline transporter [Longibacter salinarum]|uniref:Choline transporter n=1 Tax=Longibacter salinarum TaxID=1850348 RepID=A0A2A8CTU0_9BACT|nr:BCCT family transporter [Longibacter salinarum]PEN11106.1 choline transporter [Longibacter salinarum]